MDIIFGSARIDENGNISGGAAGDQTGSEVSTQSYYMHSKGWYCLRPKDAGVASKMATAMKQACSNNRIGYDQNQRNTCWTKLKKYGTLGAIAENCETDCSALVRCCIYQATGRDVGDMYTGNLASNLENSGLFNSRFSVSSEAELYNGDVLVTKSTGHTVIVVSGRARSSSSSSSTGSSTTTWKATGTATCTDNSVNVRATAGGSVIGQVNKGNRFEVDGQKSGDWVHVKVSGIGVGYIHKDYVKYDSASSSSSSSSSTTASTTTSTWKATGTATCTDNNVNVRSTPNGTVIGQCGKGNRFEVDGRVSGNWVHIKVAGIGIGYMYKDYVKYDGAASASTTTTSSSGWKATGTATCTDNDVNVRSTPGGTVIGQLGKGNRFEVDGKKNGDWVHIKVKLNKVDKIAYIHKDYVKYD